MKLVDTQDLKSCDFAVVRVQVPPRVLIYFFWIVMSFLWRCDFSFSVSCLSPFDLSGSISNSFQQCPETMLRVLIHQKWRVILCELLHFPESAKSDWQVFDLFFERTLVRTGNDIHLRLFFFKNDDSFIILYHFGCKYRLFLSSTYFYTTKVKKLIYNLMNGLIW